MVWSLSRMRGVTVDSVDATADVTDETATWRVAGLQQQRGGEWVKVGRRAPAVVKAGGALKLRVTLTGAGETRVLPVALEVPANAKRRGFLDVRGGMSVWDSAVGRANTPAELEAALAEAVRNDEVQATLSFFKRGQDLTRSDVSDPQDLVVHGSKWAEVKVRR